MVLRVLAVTVLLLSSGSTTVQGQTVITSSAFDDALRVVDVPTLEVVSEQPVTLEGVKFLGITALAVQPESGILHGALREVRCPGDPTRTRIARGGCPEFTASPVQCVEAFAINEGVPVSCFHTGSICAPCVKANEGSGCANTCLGTPVCADQALTFAGNGGCSNFNGDPGTCVQRFTIGACGPVPCFVPPSSTSCSQCNPTAIANGFCQASCGPLASRDPVHLVTIDPTTGVATSHGNLGDDVRGLAFTCDGTLFASTSEAICTAPQSRVATVDPTTATMTPILQFPDTSGVSLTFDAAAGRLLRIGSDNSGTSFFRAIDPVSLGFSARPLAGPVIENVVGAIAWQRATGDVLASHAAIDGRMYRIPANGESVALGEVGRRVSGMAFPDAGVCAVCGDATVSAGEACDDGNAVGGDCCTATCTLDPSGTPCTADGDPCNVDTCDGAGLCRHDAVTGADGATCQLDRLLDPSVCSPDALEAKLGRLLRKKGRRLGTLVDRAVAKPAKAARRVAAARRALDQVRKAIAKRGGACTARLEGIAGALAARLDEIG